MPLSFMHVLVHFCCYKAPICHNTEQQKQYDEKLTHGSEKSFLNDRYASSDNSLVVTSFLWQWTVLENIWNVVLFSVCGEMIK